MNPLDLMLLKSVAGSPDEVMRQLLSPQVGFGDGWIETPVIRDIFGCMCRMALAGQGISWLSILSSVNIPEGDLEIIKQTWKEGRRERTDWSPIVLSMKTSRIRRESDRSIKSYYSKADKSPDKIRDHIGVLGMELSVIANDGEGYDPTPSAHLSTREAEIVGSFGNAQMDKMFDGGRVSSGFVVYTAASGMGKSTMGRTIASHSIAYSKDARVVVMTNEMSATHYARGVLKGLKRLWSDGRCEEDLIRDMDAAMSVYERVYTFEKVRQILYWERPNVAILDSINAISPPEYTLKMSEHGQHKEKADRTLDLCNEFGVLMYAPGNMSEQEQKRLRGSPDDRGKRSRPEDVQSVMLFGSAAYQNAADWAFVSWRDMIYPNRQNVKRVKNRPHGYIGEIFPMVYDAEGSIYLSS